MKTGVWISLNFLLVPPKLFQGYNNCKLISNIVYILAFLVIGQNDGKLRGIDTLSRETTVKIVFGLLPVEKGSTLKEKKRICWEKILFS